MAEGTFKETDLAQVSLQPIAIRRIKMSPHVSDRLDYAPGSIAILRLSNSGSRTVNDSPRSF